MQSKQKLAYIDCMILLGDIVLLMGVLAQAPQKAQIAFHSYRDGNGEIYVMDADGNNQRRLTNNNAGDYQPAWSPDGEMIAFTSDRDGNPEIYVTDVDCKNPRRLTNNPAADGSPSWFDPAYACAVSSAGKLRLTWGWLKQNSRQGSQKLFWCCFFYHIQSLCMKFRLREGNFVFKLT